MPAVTVKIRDGPGQALAVGGDSLGFRGITLSRGRSQRIGKLLVVAEFVRHASRDPARLSGQGSQFGAQVFVFGIVKAAPAQPARRLVERGLPAGECRLELGRRRLRQNSRRQTC